MERNELAALRKAVANYMSSEGCGCCEDFDAHKKNKERLAKMLNVPKYKDGSGYDFYKFKDEKTYGNLFGLKKQRVG